MTRYRKLNADLKGAVIILGFLAGAETIALAVLITYLAMQV